MFSCVPCISSSSAQTPLAADSPAHSLGENEITNPTRKEYAVQAAKETLEIIVAVASAVPIPAFGAAVKAAAAIIKACDDSKATLERAEELKTRVQTIVVLLVDELKGKGINVLERQTKMMGDIDVLQKEMEYIKTKLDEISSQHHLLLILFRVLNDDKVKTCIAKLDLLLERFNLARNLEQTNIVIQVEQEIANFHAQQQRSLDTMTVKMDDVKAILDERLPASQASPPSRAPIPTNTGIFYGRDSLVTELVNITIGPSRRHICLLGPGGMGKTSTSLAVMGHPDVQAHFAGHLRVWVPCAHATSLSLFLDILHSSLAIPKRTGDTRAVILSELKASASLVLLLDNLETPWNAQGAQAELERFLRDVDQITHVTLFVTMRSSAAPCGDLHWHQVSLHAVESEAAQEIYEAWHPEGRDDPDIRGLLDLIGHIPLAVILMAKVAKMTHLSAAELAEEYNRVGTPMLGHGSDSETSMDVCIGLSVNSPRMRAHPQAFDLLCTLSLLPTGTTFLTLAKWWGRDIINLTGALDVLKNTALVEESGPVYLVLPVIQRFILNPSRFNMKVEVSVMDSACNFLKVHKYEVGSPAYKAHATALSGEEGNLEAVLLRSTASQAREVWDGLLLLARFQLENKPRVDVVQHALKLSDITDDNLHRGELFACYGNILFKLDQYDKALRQLKAALALFLSDPDRKRVADCRLDICTVLGFHPDATYALQMAAIREALADYDAIGDEGGYGYCLYLLGNLNGRHAHWSSALSLLNQAEVILAKTKDLQRHADCTRSMAYIYYWTGHFDQAYSWATSSFEECTTIGDLTGTSGALVILGIMASARGDYEVSLDHFLRCLQVRKSMGLLSLGEVLEGMGWIWAKLKKHTDAHKALEECLRYYSSSNSNEQVSQGAIRAQFFIKRLDDPQLQPSSEEQFALLRQYSKSHVDKILSI